MIRAFNETSPTANLVEYLGRDTAKTDVPLRRRSVLLRSPQGEWILAISIVQAFPDTTLCPESAQSRRYDGVLLLEDWLNCRQVRSFVDAVQAGTITLDDRTLTRTGGPIWQTEFVSPPNTFMDRVGFVVQTRFETRPIPFEQGPLISATEPYYPDAVSALQDWAQFVQHHGYNDARNGQIVFLLPEARAFFTKALSDNHMLHLMLAGSDVGTVSLIVKGAYYLEGKIHHFEKGVTGDHLELAVPAEVERLEYALIGTDGQLYDLQREAWGRPTGVIRQRTRHADDALVQQVRAAQVLGEGQEIEFKPFIDPALPLGSVREKTKFREILRTIAAFANTGGGSIFLGIGDDCSLGGIQGDLAKWQKAEVSDDVCSRYKGALTNKIRGYLVGDARFLIAFVTIDGAVIAIVSVSRFETAPVGLKDEGVCYVRRGSNNRYLSPHEWLMIFGQLSRK